LCEQKSENVEVNEEILANIEKAKKAEGHGTEFKYQDKDIILYNLGIGAKKTDLSYVL
jgi:multifunctional beta-oxidation protein